MMNVGDHQRPKDDIKLMSFENPMAKSAMSNHAETGTKDNNNTATDADERKCQERNKEATEAAGKSNTGDIPYLKFLMSFCSNVSVLGVRYVADPSSSSYRRLVWALLVVAGASATAYQIADRVQYYRSHPVNVVIRNEHVNELRFPTVTICSESMLSLSKMTSLGMSLISYFVCSESF